jgi:hypothetical protein
MLTSIPFLFNPSKLVKLISCCLFFSQSQLAKSKISSTQVMMMALRLDTTRPVKFAPHLLKVIGIINPTHVDTMKAMQQVSLSAIDVGTSDRALIVHKLGP